MAHEPLIPHDRVFELQMVASGKLQPTQQQVRNRKHIYTARAFDRFNRYVTHKAKIEGREAVRVFKREARQQHKNIAYWRVYNETLEQTVEK